MLYALMKECRNGFYIPGAAMHGRFEIRDGAVSSLSLLPRQYYIIKGSVFNDGLHQFGSPKPLAAEVFSGDIYPLGIPEAFIELSERVQEWQEKYGEISPFTSEKFGDYSYTKSYKSNGKQITWKTAFAREISAWRRLDEV